MECQNIVKNLKINKDKSIGEIVVVVEGESEEFKMTKYIFTEILDYNYVSIKRGKVIKNEFRSKTNPNSTVIVANTDNSSIKSIMEDEDYKDKLYRMLIADYKRSLKNTRIYILWDRDFGSNAKETVLKTLKTFRNSMDNEYDMNGILLLSYPCVESYEISNFDKQVYKKTFKNSQEAKDMYKAKRYSLTRMSCATLLNAIGNMHRSMKNIGINSYDPSDFYRCNKKIFDYEENLHDEEGVYRAISLVSIMLVDLGIIYEE